MSSFREEVSALLFGYVRVWECGNGKWAAALEPGTLGDAIDPLPPGQRFKITDEIEVYNELDDIKEPRFALQRQAARKEGAYKTLWACRPYFKDRESAIRMIYGWIRRERPEIVKWCVKEALEGRAWRAAQERKAIRI